MSAEADRDSASDGFRRAPRGAACPEASEEIVDYGRWPRLFLLRQAQFQEYNKGDALLLVCCRWRPAGTQCQLMCSLAVDTRPAIGHREVFTAVPQRQQASVELAFRLTRLAGNVGDHRAVPIGHIDDFAIAGAVG